MNITTLQNESITLLKALLAIPSISREEEDAAEYMSLFLKEKGFTPERFKNNLVVKAPDWDESKPAVMLNSHIDTVKAVSGWESDPFSGIEEDDRITGLGSNDAGAALVSLLAAFRYLSKCRRTYNLLFVVSAEEEVSGANGMEFLVPQLGKIDLAIVGEPTQMNLAVAEKGLMVLDCTAYGKAGHAARNEGENAIYKAIKDIQWIENFRFPKSSEFLGPVKMSCTQIEAGHQHNVVPEQCRFVVDVRTTDSYTNEETLAIIRKNLQSEVKARSLRLNPSGIALDHPVVEKAKKMGLRTFGSPTLSDQALMPWPSVKIGPGDSARSHTANEYIYKSEIKKGIAAYIELLEGLEIG